MRSSASARLSLDCDLIPEGKQSPQVSRTAAGEVIPRDIITSFTCRYNGREIFRAELFPAISANPYLSFFTTATESGSFAFEWIGDNGFSQTASAAITVE